MRTNLVVFVKLCGHIFNPPYLSETHFLFGCESIWIHISRLSLNTKSICFYRLGSTILFLYFPDLNGGHISQSVVCCYYCDVIHTILSLDKKNCWWSWHLSIVLLRKMNMWIYFSCNKNGFLNNNNILFLIILISF